MTKRFHIAPILLAGCCLCLYGCGTMTAQGEKSAKPAEVEQAQQAPAKDPCEIKLDELVQKARQTMKTVKETCGATKIEVNPMWTMDYDGTVHIRTYDAGGKTIRDELRKP